MSFDYRDATPADLDAIVAIYNSTVASREVTADLEPVSVESRQGWFAEHTPATYPLWVHERDGRILGWLSFSAFYGRPAYRRTTELSIYLHPDARGQGLGSAFLAAALGAAPALGFDSLLGFIFGHNQASLALFHRHGFADWGKLPGVAVLDGIERDLLILGKHVRGHLDSQKK